MSKEEFEIRIYNFNERKVKKIIKDNGGELINKKRVMPVIVYTHPNKKKDIYIRIRDEGQQITLTVKTKLKSKYPIEREVEINSVEEGEAILKLLGFKEKYRIEKIRETYNLKGCKEIVFDSMPGLPNWMEIDCHSESSLKKIAKKLGFTLEDHSTHGVSDRYVELYGITKNRKLGDLTFKTAKKVLSPYIKKNKKEFNKILNKQLKVK